MNLIHEFIFVIYIISKLELFFYNQLFINIINMIFYKKKIN